LDRTASRLTNVDSLAILLPDNELGTLNNIMRKIEALMNDAITNGTDFRSANTNVVQADGIAVVLLYGSKIAEVGDNFVRLFDGRVQSNTTKSRLNAILSVHGLPGEGVFQKKGQWFVNYDGAVIPFFSGMRLA
jgi:hypothetical protein